MQTAAPDDLPAIDVLIVDDHLRSARQLARLLELWGAASATAVASFDEAIAVLAEAKGPQLVLLDHGLTTTTGTAVALWLADRPALRQRTCVASYTNAERGEIVQALQQLVMRLGKEEELARKLLNPTSSDSYDGLASRLTAVRAGELQLTDFYHHLYDTHLSKRLSMSHLQTQLRTLSRSLIPHL